MFDKLRINSNFKNKLHIFVEILVICVVFISIFVFSLLTLPNLDQETYNLLEIIERWLLLFFTIEYLLRIFIAKNKKKYLFSFYGIIDLIAILPFYLFTSSIGPIFRLFRVLHIFRLLKIFTLSRSASVLFHSLNETKKTLFAFFMFVIFLLFLLSVLIYLVENPVNESIESLFDAIWLITVSITTVGYGDIVPITANGKVIISFVVIFGFFLITVPTSILTASITREMLKRDSNKIKNEIK